MATILHEDVARTRKALALADEIRRLMPTTPPAELAILAGAMGDDQWAEVASLADVNRPSLRTRAVVAEMLAATPEPPADPFGGLV